MVWRMTSPRALTSRGAASRDLVVRATLRVLVRGGYPAVTWRAVAAEAGVSSGVLQHHFRDRRALLQAAFSAMADDLVAHLAGQSFDGAASTGARLEGFLSALDGYLTPERNVALLQLTLGLAQEAAALPQDALMTMLVQQERVWWSLFPDVDRTTARTALRLLHATLQGLAVQRVSVGTLGEPEVRALLVQVLALVLEG